MSFLHAAQTLTRPGFSELQKPPPSWEVEVFVGVWACVSPQGDVEGNCRMSVSSRRILWWGENLILSALTAASASGGGKSKG